MTRLSGIVIFVLCLAYLGNVQGRKGFGSGEQEWSYAKVRSGAHMFWWLYYTTDQRASSYYEKPLMIWLQGGPGGSGTGFGNFEEIGPLDTNLDPRNYTWVNEYNLLFIDNPVGTGFSYVDSAADLASTNLQIAEDLVECMRDFYKKLPEFRKVPVYITSESYGGKMAAEFALLWYKAQKSGSIESNLKGVGLGDSWISPIDSVLTWAPFLLETGMVDTEGFKNIEAAAQRAKVAVDEERWEDATEEWGATEGVILRETGGIDFYNILTKIPHYGRSLNVFSSGDMAQAMLRKEVLIDSRNLEQLMNNDVKKILDVNVHWTMSNGSVFTKLYGDFMKPVTHIVDQLLDETDLKVFVYTGQLDLIVDTPGTLMWVENLKSKTVKYWQRARRVPLAVDNVIEGYKKRYKNLAFYWVNRAGHMVPADNPAATAAILRDIQKPY